MLLSLTWCLVESGHTACFCLRGYAWVLPHWCIPRLSGSRRVASQWFFVLARLPLTWLRTTNHLLLWFRLVQGLPPCPLPLAASLL
ncbi:hypothetical protein Bca4012_018642 [Brassica carinata]